MNQLITKINNNSEATIYFSLIDELLEGKKTEDIIPQIYKCYKIICKKVDISLLNERKLGRYLGLKIFFDNGLNSNNLFAGHEVISKSCQKEMYKMLQLLCEFQSNYTIQTEDVVENSNAFSIDIPEVSKIYSILEENPELLLNEMQAFQRRSDFSKELKFTLQSFNSMRQSSLTNEYKREFETKDILMIPYYYADDEFIKEYDKLPEAYKGLFQKLYECQLQQDLETDKARVAVFVSKNNRLMCMVTKKNEKIKK